MNVGETMFICLSGCFSPRSNDWCLVKFGIVVQIYICGMNLILIRNHSNATRNYMNKLHRSSKKIINTVCNYGLGIQLSDS